jgi:ribonuclease HI
MIILRFDGLFRGVPGKTDPASNAGFMCYGWLITREGEMLAQGHGAFARGRYANSNIAEYLALIEGLDALLALGIRDETIQVCGDAKSVIDQMRGEAVVSAPSIKPLYLRARQLSDRLSQVQWIWLPRRDNRDADTLSRRAMRQLRLNRGHYQAIVQAITAGKYRGLSISSLLPVTDLRVYRPSISA